ncbi:hypothetical protein SCLCIDRAFT_7473 [Scleroderma citrinum Foug A]|uniref:Uncharacterized protein n=1 Tax=Scleroderma citrinum Foug A TaxID=1036808 RepID=A0A0C3EGQ7_9AGAM|nr:hypothetical protein SCLCIDRAFT_7473 [Scleroderma citrinum Foug A]
MAAQHLPTEPEKHSRSLNRTVVIMRNRAGKFTASFQWGIRILLNSVLQDQFIAEDGGDFLAMKHTKESMTYVFDVTTELAIPYEQIMDLPRMTELATNYQNSLQYEDIAPLQLGKAALDCVTERMKVKSFEQNHVDGG